MMYHWQRKCFNNRIKVLCGALMWALMCTRIQGEPSTPSPSTSPSTYDSVTARTDAGDAFASANNVTATFGPLATSQPDEVLDVLGAAMEATLPFGGGNNSATIYDHINESDNNSNKLQQSVANEGSRQLWPAEGGVAARQPPPSMGSDHLNASDCEAEEELPCQDAEMPFNITANTSEEDNFPFTEDQPQEPYLSAILRQQLLENLAFVHKKINRITFFSCRNHCFKIACHDQKPQMLNKNTLLLMQRLFSSANVQDLMIKLVEIDHLLPRRIASPAANRQPMGYGRSMARGPSYYGGAPPRRNDNRGARGRAAFTNANWLDKILRPEHFHQLVVVDMNCGNASRRLLEMASNKALFSSMYHWLLMEDYVFNRRTEIDDATPPLPVHEKNEINCGPGAAGACESSSGVVEQEVVNDRRWPGPGRKVSFAPTSDVAGASTSVAGKQYERRLPSYPAGPERAMDAPQPFGWQAQVLAQGRGQGQGLGGGGDGGDSQTNEDDMEIIEKFLEKLNININTELILAKRRMRKEFAGIDEDGASASTKSITRQPWQAKASSLGAGDYNTLQKMDYYILYDVWSPGRQYGGKLNVSEVGEFSLRRGFLLDKWYGQSATVMRRMNMHLAQIRCLVVVTHKNSSESLYEYLTSHADTHLDSMNRFNFALLSHVRDLFNFSFILSKTSTWGYLKNGKFDGMIGALVRKQADIGGSPIFFRIERAKVIDYTTRTWVARPCFIFRHPRSTKKDRIVFLQPFSNDVWILLAACGVATILLLWALTTLEPSEAPTSQLDLITDSSAKPIKVVKGRKLKHRMIRFCGRFCGVGNGESHSRIREGAFLESMLFYIGSICQQGLSFCNSSFAGRFIILISLLFSFAIYQFYSASIVGTLLMEKPKTIRTLKDLVHSSLEIGIEDIVYNRDYFLRTKDPDAQELYAKKVTAVPNTGDGAGFTDSTPDAIELVTQVPLTAAQKAKAYRDILHSHETGAHAKTNDASNWFEPEFGVAKIRKGRFAFHVDVATAYKIIADTFSEKEICDLTEIQMFPPQKMVSIVQKGSPLRKVITYGLRRVTEVGLMDYERKVWHSPRPRCVKQLHTDDLQVDMQTFTSALLVLLFGFVVSWLILGAEIGHRRMWHRYATIEMAEDKA